MKNKLKNQKAITLLVLVITIVVLLILSGVSINTIMGNNGMIAVAKDEANKSKITAIEKSKKIWELEKRLGGTTNLADYLYSQGLITEEEKAIVEAGGTITEGEYSISFAKTLVQAFIDGEIQVGDYVNYQNPTSVSIIGEGYTSTGYTSPASKTGMSTDNGYDADLEQTYTLDNCGTQVNWRVLGLSEDGQHLLLTTGSPLKREYDTSADLSNANNPYLWLYGAESYVYGIEEMNKICAIYKNDLAEEARSMTEDDIDRITGVTTPEKIKEVNLINYYGNKQYGDSYSYDNQWTPESWLNGEEGATISGTIDGYYYSVNSKVADDAPSVTVASDLYNLLFNNTEYPTGKHYWLASRFVRDGSGYAFFGPGAAYVDGDVAFTGSCVMFFSGGRELGGCGAVRPVVSLKSGVSVDDIQKIETPTTGEEAWNYSW